MRSIRPTRVSSIALIAAALASTAAVADASPNWHVCDRSASQRTLTSAEARGQGSDLATFDFLDPPTTSYLLTHQGASGLPGDISGRTVTATFSIEKSAGATFFYDTNNNPCGTPSSARLFFQTSKSGGFDETHFWWSNPESAVLDAATGEVTISAVVEGAAWSDFNGHFGSDPQFSVGFEAAAANATYLGLSYGGGCFFANGVGVQGGSATFHLVAFSVD